MLSEAKHLASLGDDEILRCAQDDPTAPRQVLIISQSFPPLGNVAARRFGLLVRHLEAVGWRPWVLTMDAAGPLPVLIEEDRVIRIGRHPQTGPRIERPRRGLHWRMEAARRGLRRLGLRFRAVDYTTFTWQREVVRQKDAILRRLGPIDVVLGSFGPAAALGLARRLAGWLGSPWVADFRDLAAMRPDDRSAVAQWLDRLVERRALRGAVGITTVSPTLAAILARTYGLPTAVIYNGHEPLADRGEPPPVASEEPYLFYAGRFYPERAAGARLVLEALAGDPAVHWRIRSLGPGKLEEELRAEAQRRGVAKRVRFLPPCDPEQVEAEAAGAVANVVLENVEDSQEWSRGTLTGKLLELVALRPPVLALARADSDIAAVLDRTGKGRACASASQVRDFLEAARRGPASFEGDAAEVRTFSKREQAAALGRFLDKVAQR